MLQNLVATNNFFLAKRVIVSVQTIQSARLFLLSGIPNPNGLIGRFLTYHTKGDAHFLFHQSKSGTRVRISNNSNRSAPPVASSYAASMPIRTMLAICAKRKVFSV
jgi:hypothetical protein